MATLTYKCNRTRDQRPKWMQLVVQTLVNAQRYTYEGSRGDFDRLKHSLDRYIDQLRMGQLVASRVTAEIVEDSGQTVLFVKRNGVIMISVYIK